jgi:hypothetical protein
MNWVGVYLCQCMVFVMLSARALGGSLEIDQAYSRFSQEMRAHPPATSEELNQKRREILGPAIQRVEADRRAMVRAQHETAQSEAGRHEAALRGNKSAPSTMTKARSDEVVKEFKDRLHKKFGTKDKDQSSATGADASKAPGMVAPSKALPSVQTWSPQGSGQARPEVILDGSGIPKEIEFAPKKKDVAPTKRR